jgi:hypothetical protein
LPPVVEDVGVFPVFIKLRVVVSLFDDAKVGRLERLWWERFRQVFRMGF